jgi:hypothetical protein
MKMVDVLGPEGAYEVRPPGDSVGVAILDGNINQDIGSIGFFGPVRVPGVRRAVGYSGTSLFDIFAPAFDEQANQPFPTTRSLDIAQTVTAIAPSADGRLLAIADNTGISFRWSGNWVAHPAERVAVSATSQLTMSSSNLIVAANATGTITAIRFNETTPTIAAVAADTSACPAGARSQVLALAHDVVQGDVILLSRYGTTLASELLSDDSATVTQRCLSQGPMSGIISGAVTASTLDRSGARAILVAGSTAYVYDTNDMALPMSEVATAGSIEGVFLPESGGQLLFYGPNSYYPQRLNEQ